MNCKLKELFVLQRQALAEYDPIEEKNGSRGTGLYECLYRDTWGYTDGYRSMLDSREVQARIREHFERYVEEMAEAFDARMSMSGEKYLEELVDCSKFLINMFIVIGMRPSELVVSRGSPDLLTAAFDQAQKRPRESRVDQAMWLCVGSAAHACSYLRNTPWRQKEKATDVQPFQVACVATFQRFIDLLVLDGITASSFFLMFRKKTKINTGRIAGGY